MKEAFSGGANLMRTPSTWRLCW